MSRPTALFMTAPHIRMRFFPLKALLVAAFSIGYVCSSFGANPHWEKLGTQPVYIQQIRARSEQTLKFIGFEDGRLIAEVDVDGRIGEMSMPVSETMASSLRFDLAVMEEAKDVIRKEKFSAATELWQYVHTYLSLAKWPVTVKFPKLIEKRFFLSRIS